MRCRLLVRRAVVFVCLLCGAAFATDLVDLPLNGSLDATVHGKEVAAEAVGDVAFVPGRDGKAARLDGRGAVTLPIGECWPIREGCAEFWIRPQFSGGDNQNYWLLCDSLGKFRLFKYTNAQLYFQVQCDDRGVNCAGRCTWSPGEWHHVAVAWRNFNSGKDDGVMMLYSDGQLIATAAGNFRISKAGSVLRLGSDPKGERGAKATISRLRVRDVAKIDYRPKRGEIMAHDPRDYALSALGATVKASSEIKSFRGKSYLGMTVIDGCESGAYWCTDFPNGATAPHRLEIDLGQEREVGRIVLYMRKSKGTGLKTFRIEGRTDGEWQTIQQVDDYDKLMEAAGPRARYLYPFGVFIADIDPPQTLRHIRLHVDSPGTVRLHEIEVLPPASGPKHDKVDLANAGPVLRLDFGSATSPVEEGWIPISDETRCAGGDAGWQGAGDLIGVDRLEGYLLMRDLIAGVAGDKPTHHTFSVKRPNGAYAVAVVAGDLGEAAGPFRILAEGKVVAPRVGTRVRGGWDAQTFVVDVTDGQLDLTFEPEGSWAVMAAIVAPADRFDDVQRTLEQVEDRLAKRSAGLLKGLTEHRPEEPKGDLAATDERKTRGYELFHPAIARQVFPTTVPSEADVTREVCLSATPGEYEAASLAIRTFRPLRDVRLRVTELRGPGVIAPERIDVQAVRCWVQKEERWLKSEYMVVPELLEPQGRHGELWVRADATKQFWLTVHVPDDAEAGVYEGTITLTAANAKPTKVKLALRVLPFRLHCPKPMSLGIYYYPAEEDGDELVLSDLRNMRAHGLNTIAFGTGRGAIVKGKDGYQFDLRYIRWVMGLLRKAGVFTGPFPLYMGGFGFHHGVEPETEKAVQDFIRVVEAERAKQGWPELLYYPVDEPFAGERLKHAVPAYQACKRVPNIRTYCTVSGLAAETLAPWLDVRCHTLTATNGFFWPKVYESAIRDGDEFWWYSNATRHYPDCMRMKAGFFHWKVKATGQSYWHYCNPCGSPFCDLDATSRDHIAVYPGLDGPLHTIQWECHREGLDDARYAWTLEHEIRQAERSGVRPDAIAAARKVLAELSARVNVDLESYDKKYPFRRYAFHYFCAWPPEGFDQARTRLAEAILALRRARK